MTQTIIVMAIIVAAVAWAIWIIIRRARSGGCASCESSGSCPYANKGVCPSEQVDQAAEEREAGNGK